MYFTRKSNAELIAYGRRFTLPRMAAQVDATLARVDGDDEVRQTLPSVVIDGVRNGRAKLDAARAGQLQAGQAYTEASGAELELVNKLRLWRRRAAASARILVLAGFKVPERLASIGDSSLATAELVQDTLDRTTLLEAMQSGAPYDGDIRKLIEEGRTLAGELARTEARQSQAQSDRSPATDEVRLTMGLLYIGLKMINTVGQSVHADDPTRSAQYNLSILYGRASSAAAEPAGPVAQPGSAPAAPPPA